MCDMGEKDLTFDPNKPTPQHPWKGSVDDMQVVSSFTNTQERRRGGAGKDDEHEECCYIPECLLDQIFIRLPEKSVFQFKCVQKRWLSHTLSPSFIRSFCQSRTTSPPWALLYQYPAPGHNIVDEIRLDRLYSLHNISPQLSVLLSFPDDRMKIVAGNNGLLCCRPHDIDEGGRYQVCNPTTKQWAVLPPVPYHFRSERYKDIIDRRRYKDIEGLIAVVEDGLFSQYKVVVPHGSISFQVFCSETGEWTHFMPFPLIRLPSAYLSEPIALGRTLYWPCYRRRTVVTYEPFGNEDESVRLIELPRWHLNDVQSRMCGVSAGHLRYFEAAKLDDTYALKVWELEDSISGQWSIKHECLWTDVWSNDGFLNKILSDIGKSSKFSLEPVAFHPFDSDVMYLHNRKHILSFNIRGRSLDILCDPQSYFQGSFQWKMMPFVLPHWPTPLPHPFWRKTYS